MKIMWGSGYLAVFYWVLQSSVKAGALALLILLLKFILKDKINARVQYLLWSVVVFGLILPWSPQSSLSINNFILPQVHKVQAPLKNEAKTNLDSSGSNKSIANPADLSNDSSMPVAEVKNSANILPDSKIKPVTPAPAEGLFVLWLMGIVGLTVMTLLRNRMFAAKLAAIPVSEDDVLEALAEAKAKLKVKLHIPPVQTAAVSSPSLYGVFRPKLLLPERVQEKLSKLQLTYVCVHELAHFKRQDILVNWIINVLVIVHWFNPVIWYSAYKIRQDQELACDAYSLSCLGHDKVNDYGHTLIALIDRQPRAKKSVSLAGLSGGPDSHIKRRLNMLKLLGKPSFKWSLLAVVLVLAVSFVTLTSARASGTGGVANVKQTAATKSDKLVSVNSIQPAKLNWQLVDSVRKNSQSYHSFNSLDDIASIAYGTLTRDPGTDPALKAIHEQAIKLLPSKPILVKSYDYQVDAYYLVPFYKGQKFVGPMILGVSTFPENQRKVRIISDLTFDGQTNDFPGRDKLFPVDMIDAINLVKNAKGLKQVPIPQLVQKSKVWINGVINTTDPKTYPLWEFTLAGNKKLYVNQQGHVQNIDILPWYEKLPVPTYNPKAVKIEKDKLTRNDGWGFSITSLGFNELVPDDPTQKSLSLTVTGQNNAGPDKLFMPKGSIVSITSSSGKTYPLKSDTFDKIYISIQQMRMEGKMNTQIKPGVFAVVYDSIMVNAADTHFSKVTYRDELGNDFNIPIDIIPTPAKIQKHINGVMQPYKVPGQDWSLSITQLEFRGGVNTKTRLASVGLTLTGNSGAGTAFSPQGKLIGLVGTSGKYYPLDEPNTLDVDYAGNLQDKIQRAKETGTLYQPGVMTIIPELLISHDERNFTKIIYQDKKGLKFTIPIKGITPVFEDSGSR